MSWGETLQFNLLRKQNAVRLLYATTITILLVVGIPDFQPGGPGSISDVGTFFNFFTF